jgi:putative ABC transport system substrate-binding protein
VKRRAVLLAAAALASMPLLAQRAGRMRRVGLIAGGETKDAHRFVQAFMEGMKEHGYHEGRDFELAVRSYDTERANIPALADELIAWQADVIVANISSTAAILKKKTSTVPIVMVTAVDAVAEGLVQSLARPGGNITGMTSFGPAQHAKLVELARELLPRARRIALAANPNHALSKSYVEVAAEAAKARGLEMVTLEVRSASELEQFAERLRAARADVLVIATDAVLWRLRDGIVDAGFKARLPAVALLPEFIDAGAVATLGYDITGNYRGAARYVDRIFKGAKPADLPVEQPTQFELALNLKSAKGLGITIPPALIARANRIVE